MEEQVVNQEQPTQAIQQEQPQQDSTKHHLYTLRKRLDEESAARQAAERRAQEAEQRMQSYQQPQQKVESVDEDDIAVDNEDYIQAKYVKTSNKKMKGKISTQQQEIDDLKKGYAYLEAKVYTDSLKDFKSIVNDESLKLLAQLDPIAYSSIAESRSKIQQSHLAYTLIKSMGIDKEIKEDRHQFDVDRRIQENRQRPQSASNAGAQTPPKTPIGHTDEYGRRRMTDERAAQIRANMQRKKSQVFID